MYAERHSKHPQQPEKEVEQWPPPMYTGYSGSAYLQNEKVIEGPHYHPLLSRHPRHNA